MSSARISALAKLVDVGEFNLLRYYPFSGEEVRKNYKWYPTAYQNFKQVAKLDRKLQNVGQILTRNVAYDFSFLIDLSMCSAFSQYLLY